MSQPPLPPAATPVTTTQVRRLALAFQAVFGQTGRNGRSSDQRLVLAHLRKVAYADAPVFQENKAGVFDPYAAAHRDGARTISLIIDRQLENAKKANEEEEKSKPKSIR